MATKTRLTVYVNPEDKGVLQTLAFLAHQNTSEYVGMILAAHCSEARLGAEEELRAMAQARRRAAEQDRLRMVISEDTRTLTAYREMGENG